MLAKTRLKNQERRVRMISGQRLILAGGSRYVPPNGLSKHVCGDLVYIMFSGSGLLVYDDVAGEPEGQPEIWQEQPARC